MERFRVFIKADIKPQTDYIEGATFNIYIPEPIAYDTKQKALDSKKRWDYSFGLNNGDVVILIRHMTVIDNGYVEIRNMPEFCYDYDTFINLGGLIECVTGNQNIINIERIRETFNSLYPNLVKDTCGQIHIEPIDMQIVECGKKDIRIPTPVNNIIQNNYMSAGNNNCNRPLADESFYKALAAFVPHDIKGKQCHITENYVSVSDFEHHAEGIMYDARMQKIVRKSEWEKHCYEHTVEQKRERKRALEKQGLLDAYNSLKIYLQNHSSIRKIECDASKDWQAPYEIVERDLTYGYKLTGFEILEDAVVWEITTYERPIKQNDCIRGMDTCYLMFKNGITVEAVRKMDYILLSGREGISEKTFETYSNTYIDISCIQISKEDV